MFLMEAIVSVYHLVFIVQIFFLTSKIISTASPPPRKAETIRNQLIVLNSWDVCEDFEAPNEVVCKF